MENQPVSLCFHRLVSHLIVESAEEQRRGDILRQTLTSAYQKALLPFLLISLPIRKIFFEPTLSG